MVVTRRLGDETDIKAQLSAVAAANQLRKMLVLQKKKKRDINQILSDTFSVWLGFAK